MRVPERASQIWPVLVLAARQRQTLTYDLLARLIGVPRPALGQLLEPIQSYCLVNALPALTAIVVSDSTGLPGTGFTAAEDIPQMHAQVFAHDWLTQQAPTPEEFAAAVAKRPSNAVRPMRDG
jgi:hypothetical protein